MNFRAFKNIPELIEHLKANDHVYYHAPLDYRPVCIKVQEYTISNEKPERSTVKIWTKENGTLKFKLAEHFDRFRVRES